MITMPRELADLLLEVVWQRAAGLYPASPGWALRWRLATGLQLAPIVRCAPSRASHCALRRRIL